MEDISSGKTLSGAMARHPDVFSPVFVAMVGAGEESGQLADSLRIVAGQLDKSFALQRKVRGAMMYPAIIMFVMIVIGILMLIFVVPNLVSTFAEFKVELPLSTRIVIGLSGLLRSYVIYLLAAVIFIGFLTYKWLKTYAGRRTLDFVLLHMPLIGGIVKQVNAATTARTLSSLISSGVNMLEALDITQKVVQNTYYKDVILKARDGVEKGQPLSGFFQREEKLYPILLGEMAEVGEETGKLSDMLLNIATFYEAEVDAITKDMSTIIEPFLMLFIGVAVGFFAISMVQPMYAISGAM
jgi:type IV pilus assembly protein PilC